MVGCCTWDGQRANCVKDASAKATEVGSVNAN
jgi:hypothetical protein